MLPHRLLELAKYAAQRCAAESKFFKPIVKASLPSPAGTGDQCAKATSVISSPRPRNKLEHANFTGNYTVPVPKHSAKSKCVLTAAADAKRGRVLHLFSGPSGRVDNLANYLRTKGWEVDDYDHICNSNPDQDICADHIWDEVRRKLKSGFYTFVIAGTPCETFSHSRHVPPGPRPIRSAAEPYGLRHGLTASEKEQVRTANLCVVRTAEACRLVAEHDGGFLVENPRPWDGFESMWLFEEIKALQKDYGAKVVDFDQCRWGSETTKPTRVLYHNCFAELLERTCNHPKREWVDRRGYTYWASHERPVQRFRENGERATKALGAWPAPLNQAFAMLVHHSSARRNFQ